MPKGKNKKQFDDTKQPSESDITEMLKLSEQEFKTTIINKLRALMNKADSMQKQMGKVGKQIEIPRTKK